MWNGHMTLKNVLWDCWLSNEKTGQIMKEATRIYTHLLEQTNGVLYHNTNGTTCYVLENVSSRKQYNCGMNIYYQCNISCLLKQLSSDLCIMLEFMIVCVLFEAFQWFVKIIIFLFFLFSCLLRLTSDEWKIQLENSNHGYLTE